MEKGMKKTLEEQFQLLSERSKGANDNYELAKLTDAMCKVADLLTRPSDLPVYWGEDQPKNSM